MNRRNNMQKTTFKTRLLALLTAAFMVVMCVPFAAFAAGEHKQITINWIDAKTGVPLTDASVVDNDQSVNAPDAGEGYCWEDTMTNDGKTFNSGEAVSFAYMESNAHFLDDGMAYYSFKKVEKPAAPKKHFNVTFTVDSNKGSFTDYGAGPVVFNGYEDEVGDQQFDIPAVTAKEGYKFVGWKGQGASEIAWNADAKSLGVSGMCFYAEGSTEGYASIEAVFEEDKTEPEQPAAPKKHFTVNFTVDPKKGSFTEYGAGPVKFEGYEEEVGDQQYDVPAVTAKEGYKFVGWKGQGASEIAWNADAKTFGVTGLCFYAEGSTEGYASIEAQFEEVKTEPEEPEVKKTVSVTITTNNEQGIFPDYDGQEVIHFDNLDPDTDQQFELPKVEAKPGYEFIGWHVNGNEVGAWDADAKTFGITGLAHFEKGSNVGYLTIAAVYKAETERTVEVTFSVDPDKGEFEKNDLYTSPAANVMKLTATEFDGTQYAIPTVKAKAGYKFVGWKGQGADVIAWDAEAKTFGVTGLCFFNGDDATTGYATVEAVFEKVEDKKNDNSSSSSSASSSSNKTTTASNEKQVVKAAAAPANTTKVLPKTGASNVAPLLGGSLAVVALLMGYGVYGLVLRKKD